MALLVATALAAGSLALTATPAHAIGVCSINGIETIAVDDTITGTEDNDTIYCVGLSLTDLTIDALGGNDTITVTGDASHLEVNAGDGNDNIFFLHDLDGDSEIDGGAGNDTVRAIAVYGSNVYGGTGNDTFHLSKVVRSDVSGDEGNDTIYVDDILGILFVGGATVAGGDGDDLIRAEPPRRDTYVGEGNTVDGEAGTDTCFYVQPTRGDVENCEITS
ncbi:hypothetical protein [Streptomyces sp. NBRC 110465]|uniref:hypothetical protein n=1 Tax=Streptomyces sp. NBRC 110465 TaxID=1897621 RepID=UPI0009343E7A|nr:hypothetical protein [Streptomyces sp. NBRC 110465]